MARLSSFFPGRSTRSRRIIIGLGVLAAFFISSITLIRRNNGPRAPVVAREATPIPTVPPQENGGEGFSLNEFHRSETRDGRIIWEVHGKSGQYLPAENIAKVKDP